MFQHFHVKPSLCSGVTMSRCWRLRRPLPITFWRFTTRAWWRCRGKGSFQTWMPSTWWSRSEVSLNDCCGVNTSTCCKAHLHLDLFGLVRMTVLKHAPRISDVSRAIISCPLMKFNTRPTSRNLQKLSTHSVYPYLSTPVGSVALLVARRITDRKVAGSRPTKVVCITVLTGNRMGDELPAVAGRHSFFRAVGSWSLDCQRWWTRIWRG